MTLSTVFPIYITDITVFETWGRKHKPVFVKGREFCSLTYRHRGSASIKCGDAELLSTADTVTFVPRGVDYITEITSDVHVTAIHFNFAGADIPDRPSVVSADNPRILALFDAIAKTANDPTLHFRQLSIAYELFDELSKMKFAIDKGRIPEKIARAREIIEAGYSDPLFSIEGLADELNVSTTYLRREFSLATGMSPIAYLKDVRIRRALQLLLSNDLTVNEIASKCGYSSISYFIQDFHKNMGEPPSRYRARLLTAP